MMNTIELTVYEIRNFLRFLGEHRKSQPEPCDIHKYFISISNDNEGLISPAFGDFHWTYNGEQFLIEFHEEGDHPCESAMGPAYFQRMYIHHPDLTKLHEFVTHALTWTKDVDERKVRICHSKSRGYWDVHGYMYVQSIDKVYLDPTLKSNILKRIDNFLASKERFTSFGRPYKLNFLLSGVPGSGKTSLVKAIAHKYRRTIYVLNFSKNMTDENLVELMAEVKDNSILLLEDVDAFFLDRKSQDINVSFSCLINVLDGTLCKSNGIITFLTANNPERLDPAMIRPGRIDSIIRFDYPRKTEIETAFIDLTGESSKEKFLEFYKHIKSVRVSMSAIIDYLFNHPNDYIENINELLDQTQLLHEIVNDKTDKMYN